MKQATKETVYKVLVAAAMVTPPWNVFWWTVGGIVYAVSGGKGWDTSGDGALAVVIGAPVTLPMLPFMLLKDRRELREREKRQALYAKAATWIATELARSGIAVQKHGAGFMGVDVTATPDGPSQENEHAVIYALAVRRFASEGLTIDEICERAEPLHTLDRTWAKVNGFTAWAEEVFTKNCVDCGQRLSLGWFFGGAADGMRRLESRHRSRIALKDGSERVVDGHICRECLEKIDYRFISS